jgi:hypothetical protein
MASTKSRAAGAAASTLILAAVGLVWTSGDAAAYAQCVITITADHYSVSASCPIQGNGTHFRVKTYLCDGPYNTWCGSTPVYGAWEPWYGTSSVYAYPSYVDTSRATVEIGKPTLDPV